MTPIEKVFMLPIDARLDYETLRRVCESGHSRVPVYEEVEVKVGTPKIAKKIVGILLVKQCVLLDPKGTCSLWHPFHYNVFTFRRGDTSPFSAAK